MLVLNKLTKAGFMFWQQQSQDIPLLSNSQFEEKKGLGEAF
jgi:hypothetical protein